MENLRDGIGQEYIVVRFEFNGVAGLMLQTYSTPQEQPHGGRGSTAEARVTNEYARLAKPRMDMLANLRASLDKVTGVRVFLMIRECYSSSILMHDCLLAADCACKMALMKPYSNLRWKETPAYHWERGIDEAERFYACLAKSFEASGRTFLAITGFAYIFTPIRKESATQEVQTISGFCH